MTSCRTSSLLVVLVVYIASAAGGLGDGPQSDQAGAGAVPVESDGRPRGSFNRWNYNEVHHPATEAVPRQTPVAHSAESRRHRFRQPQKLHSYTTTPPPTPGRHVELEAKQDVDWAYDSLSFYLRASSDMRFKIRHAHIPAYGTPWPMPRIYHPHTTVYRLIPSQLQLNVVGGKKCEILRRNFRRIHRNIFGENPHKDGAANPASEVSGSSLRLRVVHHLNITVLKECTEFPYLEMDESYDLDIKPSGISIIAVEVWGALRGMETFSQLVYEDDTGHFIVNKTLVHDYPRFKHRGILLDTSRHYLDKETVIENLEAMAQNKMNVFHWHIVDDQSFPYVSKVFPDLSRLGAYDPVTHVYTHENIAEIIEEARVRGIRVIPEFDTPGHTFSWGYGQDHLLTPCYDYRYRPNGLFGPINPILRKTYGFLRRLFAEVMDVFKDRYIHLGGDEVPFDCWQMNPALKNFMKRNNLTDVRDLLSVYEKKLVDIVGKLGETRKMGAGYIVWQEVFDNNVKVKPDTIIQVWSGDSYNIDHVTQSGFRALFSTCWYLDYINYGQDWDKYYNCDQINMSPTDYRVDNESLLIGGEVCLWTEFADDDSIMPRLWPRASAAAERLWSDRNVNNFQQAAPRIEAHRCRMMRQGVRVGVLSGPGHCTKSRHHRYGRTRSSEVPVAVAASGSHRNSDTAAAAADSDNRFLRVQVHLPHQVDSASNMLSPPLSIALWLCPLLVFVAVSILLCLLCLLRRPDLPIHSRLISTVQRLHVRSLPQLITVFITFAVIWAVWSSVSTWTPTTAIDSAS